MPFCTLQVLQSFHTFSIHIMNLLSFVYDYTLLQNSAQNLLLVKKASNHVIFSLKEYKTLD